MELTACRHWNPEGMAQKFPAMLGHGRVSYLDNAATTQRLASAIAAHFEYESSWVGNANRGSHALAAGSSAVLEEARVALGSFLGISEQCVAFTSGATESANLLAHALGERLSSSDCVYASSMEHHSNYLPWVEAARSAGARFEEIPVMGDGSIDMDWYSSRLEDDKPAIVAITAMSNVTGYAPPVAEMRRLAKEARPDAIVVVDAAQAVGRMARGDALWGGDFAFFSGHKMHATGSGVLAALNGFDKIGPGKVGGGMLRGFRGNGSPRWASGHVRFEAGSPNVGAAASMAAAANEMCKWNVADLMAHEEALSSWMFEELSKMEGVHVVGSGFPRHGVLSFWADWAHAHDIGTVMDGMGVMARVGHHCAIPLMRSLGVDACVRLSCGVATVEADVLAAMKAVAEAKRILS